MWFWPVNEKTELVLHSFFFYKFYVPLTCFRVPAAVRLLPLNSTDKDQRGDVTKTTINISVLQNSECFLD
jgi:hypothetical protein